VALLLQRPDIRALTKGEQLGDRLQIHRIGKPIYQGTGPLKARAVVRRRLGIGFRELFGDEGPCLREI
jgi:hypothetical protein